MTALVPTRVSASESGWTMAWNAVPRRWQTRGAAGDCSATSPAPRWRGDAVGRFVTDDPARITCLRHVLAKAATDDFIRTARRLGLPPPRPPPSSGRGGRPMTTSRRADEPTSGAPLGFVPGLAAAALLQIWRSAHSGNHKVFLR